jgi:hypothetical protein
MLALPDCVVYVNEPFNVNRRSNWYSTSFDLWFTYVTAENERLYYRDVKRIIDLRYDWRRGLRNCRSAADLWQVVKRYARFLRRRRWGHVPLLKDPIAVLSAEWLHERFDIDVVVMIRHPVAFAGSLKEHGWKHPFSHFLEQPLLMEEHLHPFESEIREFAEKEQDVVDQAALLWKIIYSVVLKYRGRYKDWIFLRHEDVARDPQSHFAQLYGRLGLAYSRDVARTVAEYSSPKNPAQEMEGLARIRRDSESTIHTWKERLTAAEVGRVKERVSDVAKEFYADDEW